MRFSGLREIAVHRAALARMPRTAVGRGAPSATAACPRWDTTAFSGKTAVFSGVKMGRRDRRRLERNLKIGSESSQTLKPLRFLPAAPRVTRDEFVACRLRIR